MVVVINGPHVYISCLRHRNRELASGQHLLHGSFELPGVHDLTRARLGLNTHIYICIYMYI